MTDNRNMKQRHKATIYWATRALLPLHGVTPMEVKDGVGRVGGYVICVGNFEKVEAKLRHDYESESQNFAPRDLPIWC
ncbi:hypothetical protein PhaeoP24_04264 (plasmid) [Phaeobacter inhibens]|uniref:hypothetical protein n=1 Tax=Phaeobacter TaxID=302485 RepID=UPI000C9A45F2|nr:MULTISPECIES: hypothetical protein [Phaeobacter]AUQ92822.1 hypothetical protein PhaeoP24_04264 [Phaeobacter inhibens]AUR38377.1 hypothetical protein PhaeoP18_04161 [Phaeobacter piscinae]